MKDEAPFAALGVEHGVYYFKRFSHHDVFSIQHFRRIDMERLAPLSYWQEVYQKERGGIDWVQAKWDVMAKCETRGDRLVRRLARGPLRQFKPSLVFNRIAP